MDNMNYINENNNGYINTLNNINKFDDHFLNLNSYYGLGCKVVKYMFSFTSILCISFFLPEDFDDEQGERDSRPGSRMPLPFEDPVLSMHR